MSDRIPTPERLALGAALKALRERRGIRPVDLARRAGMPRSQVSEIEHGRANPTFETLRRMLEVLGGEFRIFTRVQL